MCCLHELESVRANLCHAVLAKSPSHLQGGCRDVWMRRLPLWATSPGVNLGLTTYVTDAVARDPYSAACALSRVLRKSFICCWVLLLLSFCDVVVGVVMSAVVDYFFHS